MITTNRVELNKNFSDKLKGFNIQKWAIWFILVLLAADTIYSTWYGINMHTREKCVIYRFLPRWLFLMYEYLIELFMVVLAGAFAGVIAEKYFTRYRRWMPKNPVTAFIYASVIPVCSCSAVPLIESMKNRLPLRTIISFVMAAPLLNPYIIFLSFSVLGVKYGIYRILGSFLISVITGLVVERVYIWSGKPEIGIYKNCQPVGCGVGVNNTIYGKTWRMIGQIGPFILLAGLMGLLLEFSGPLKIVEALPLDDSMLSVLILTGIGTAIYLCNGADILFLAPLLAYTDLGLGNALAFSLASTAVCVTSIVMLSRFLGKRLTTALVASVVFIIISFSLIITHFA